MQWKDVIQIALINKLCDLRLIMRGIRTLSTENEILLEYANVSGDSVQWFKK